MKRNVQLSSMVMNIIAKIKAIFTNPISFNLNFKLVHLMPMILAMPVIVYGFSIITKNIKPTQSASAEQIAGSPESGVKSRISELYDVLAARNLGSDTDTSGMDVLTDNWGAKWNRIKSAALKNTGSGMSSEDKIINFVYSATGLKWSYPVYRAGNRVVADGKGYTVWSWSDSGVNNQAVGGKTAEQVCQALGAGWRLPRQSEVDKDYFLSLSHMDVIKKLNQSHWSSSLGSSPGNAIAIWINGSTEYSAIMSSELLLRCVKQ
jgi:hypothetical protein